MLDSVAVVAPPEVMTILREQTTSIASRERGGLLTIGLAGAIWSSSAAVVAVAEALNRAYDIEESRPWWKVRGMALGLTITLAVLVLLALGLILVGPVVAGWLGTATGMGGPLTWAWTLLQWPFAFALVVLGLALLNYFAPDADQDWTWITPGAVLATTLWLLMLLISLGFRLYLSNVADYNATYGSLGGVIVLLLWFYLSGAAGTGYGPPLSRSRATACAAASVGP